MNFSEWLEKNEGLYRPPGSFDPKKWQFNKQEPAPAPAPTTHPARDPNPMKHPTYDAQAARNNSFGNINDRVRIGKGVEGQIYDSLVACGMKLRPASEDEDKYSKIDGWWQQGTKEVPIQIKYRQTGNDILFEVMKDYDRNVQGRDMVGLAKYYAVMDTTRKIKVVAVDEAKTIIRQAVEKAKDGGFDRNNNYEEKNVIILRVRQDNYSGQRKLMAYINPDVLTDVKPPCIAK